MSSTLLITASPNVAEHSYSRKVTEHFIQCLEQVSGESLKVRHIELYGQELINLDGDTLDAMANLKSGQSLNRKEQKLLDDFGIHVSEFLSHRDIIISSPLWNFGIPPRLKAYIDAIVIPGRTFRYTEKGAEGLLTNKGYRLTYIQASGSLASVPPISEIEHGSKYIGDVFRFMGFEDIENIFVEGVAIPSIAENALFKAQGEALEVAKRWCGRPPLPRSAPARELGTV